MNRVIHDASDTEISNQDLTSQVSVETDPVQLLSKVVALLYMQVWCCKYVLNFLVVLYVCVT